MEVAVVGRVVDGETRRADVGGAVAAGWADSGEFQRSPSHGTRERSPLTGGGSGGTLRQGEHPASAWAWASDCIL